MNQITTRYITENGACYEQYVITDPEAKTALTITPERGGMITSFTLDGEEFVWTRRPNFSECNRPRFGVPVLFPSCGNPDNGVHIFGGKAYPMETHGFADLCAWEVDSVGPVSYTHLDVYKRQVQWYMGLPMAMGRASANFWKRSRSGLSPVMYSSGTPLERITRHL